ncbi:Dehydrogenases with different specificities (Related to short-chain alcohol dehydrogenases) [uncultured delta proteobacterium]|uniref:Dehydrogenases with different specificities (Related to short-chain alcohol dehydrogenases) n=1 Tax=uncultured delta proteobacterium TaxID=34034 RepID=A0A212KGR9_9DELT|nr:Dehydrogenases with different specificities (Related to short-chain alcohol dehydrogenases) [uncultured delta proteobacterium]
MPHLLQGKFGIVTGANQGLGLEIARLCLRAGVSGLALCARNSAALDAAVAELQHEASPQQAILALQADVSNQDHVERFCRTALETFGDMHFLINNAGIYGPVGPIESVDWNEWQQALAINLGGSVLMCRALIPHFKKKREGKIIQISGGGATNPMPNFTAYAASKAAVVRFVESLAKELAEYGIDVNSIAPGLLDTRLLQEVVDAGPDAAGKDFYDKMIAAKESGKTTPLSLGAELAVFLASDASRGITGRLISAQWDKWREWPNHLSELESSDMYTLRRITGRDRGHDWGDV